MGGEGRSGAFRTQKREDLAPLRVFGLNRAIPRLPRGVKGARTSRPRPSSSRRRRAPRVHGTATPVGPLRSPSRQVAKAVS